MLSPVKLLFHLPRDFSVRLVLQAKQRRFYFNDDAFMLLDTSSNNLSLGVQKQTPLMVRDAPEECVVITGITKQKLQNNEIPNWVLEQGTCRLYNIGYVIYLSIFVWSKI